MVKAAIGIDDLALYLPHPRISLEEVISRRGLERPERAAKLAGAREFTGQTHIRFPDRWEDSAVLGANAALTLLDRGKLDPKTLRFLVAGTETGVDMSKSMSAYIQGMLDLTKHRLPGTLSSFQIQHACAGATIGMIAVAAMLSASGDARSSGLVVATDIARYELGSSAELTQGSGAAAFAVSHNPRLVELALDVQGFSSRNTDDFFRPNWSVTAKVRGRYSMQCYHNSLIEAVEDLAARSGRNVADVLAGTDYFIFHVPFVSMARTAVEGLIGRYLGYSKAETTGFLGTRSFYEALEVTAGIGNMYTGAIYLNLAATLFLEYQKHGDRIAGKRLLFSSYGSGNTMLVFEGIVSKGAAELIKRWQEEDFLNHYREVDWAEYLYWVGKTSYSPVDSTQAQYHEVADADVAPGKFFLRQIREDGYRVYGFRQ